MPFDPAAINHMSKQDAEALRASLDNYLASLPPGKCRHEVCDHVSTVLYVLTALSVVALLARW
jgi:hypothetical protein